MNSICPEAIYCQQQQNHHHYRDYKHHSYQNRVNMQSTSNEQLNEIKTQLIAREGVYRLVPGAEYCRPKSSSYTTSSNASANVLGAGVGGGGGTSAGGTATTNAANGNTSMPCRISFTKFCLPKELATNSAATNATTSAYGNNHHHAHPHSSANSYYTRLNHSNERLNSRNSNCNTANSNSNNSSSNNNNNNNGNQHNIKNNNSNFYHHHQQQHSHSNGIMSSTGASSQSNNDIDNNNRCLDNCYKNFDIEERICFNVGREVYMYSFSGTKPSDLTKLNERRTYKASCPTCHDIYSDVDKRAASMLIGFNTGQAQMINLYRSEINQFFNQERLIEKSKATCIRYLPGSGSSFLISYASGQMYLFNEEISCLSTAPNYQVFKSGDGYTIYTCKTKTTRNPIFRWSIGEGAIHEFAFSPCGEMLAVVSQDGFLRVFHYDRMELIGRMRSYFGGMLCIGWSPDSRFIATGGEDDLITVWSVMEKRVIARGQGHKSWVNAVRFDPYMTTYNSQDISIQDDSDEIVASVAEDTGACDSGDDVIHHSIRNLLLRKRRSSQSPPSSSSSNRNKSAAAAAAATITTTAAAVAASKSISSEFNITSYRIGSVGQDTQICFWDLTDDIIRQSSQHTAKSRASLSIANTTSIGNISNDSNGTMDASLCHTSFNDSKQHNNHHHHQPNGTIRNLSSNIGNASSSQPQSQQSHQKSSHHHHNFFNSLLKSTKSSSSSSSEHKHHKTFSLSSRSFSDKHAKSSSAANSSATNGNMNQSALNGGQVLTNCTGSLGANHHQNHHLTNVNICDPGRLLGTPLCPRLDDVPMLEPHVCKKIAHERLTSLLFHRDCFLVANQDGKVTIWSRPSQMNNKKISSPNTSLASDVNEMANCDDNSSAIV